MNTHFAGINISFLSHLILTQIKSNPFFSYFEVLRGLRKRSGYQISSLCCDQSEDQTHHLSHSANALDIVPVKWVLLFGLNYVRRMHCDW